MEKLTNSAEKEDRHSKKKNREIYDGKKKEDRNQHGPSEKRIALTNIKQVKADGAGDTSAS